MDFVSNASALRAIVRTIENDVIPSVTDTHAAGQLWAATGLLNNIASELDRVPADADRSGVVGENLESYLEQFAVGDTVDWGEAATRLTESLGDVIAGHKSLHYRRAIQGFSSSA